MDKLTSHIQEFMEARQRFERAGDDLEEAALELFLSLPAEVKVLETIFCGHRYQLSVLDMGDFYVEELENV